MLTLIEKILFALAVLASLYFTYVTFSKMARIVRRGQGQLNFEDWPRRLKSGLVALFNQGRIHRYRRVTSIFHYFIAWGFIYYFLVNLVDLAEGYIPGWSHGPEPQMISHETVCLLNASDQDAQVEITIFFKDREPAGPYRLAVQARRTRHLRFNALQDPEPIPKDTPYASVIESDVPVVVQHTRLDSRQAENALMTTIAFAGD